MKSRPALALPRTTWRSLRRTRLKSFGACVGELQIGRHPDLQAACRIRHTDLHRIYEIGALVSSLNRRRRELGFRCDPGDDSVHRHERAIALVHADLHLLAQANRCELSLGDVRSQRQRIEARDLVEWLAHLHHFALLRERREYRAGYGIGDTAARDAISDLCDAR